MAYKSIERFSAKDMLCAPRRSSAIPSSTGDNAIISTKVYSFCDHSFAKTLALLDLNSGNEKVLFTDSHISEATWLREDIAFLRDVPADGFTELVIYNINSEKEFLAWTFESPVSNLRFSSSGNAEDGIAFVVSGKRKPDGSLFNEKKEPKRHGTGKIYDKLFVRHWDAWIEPQKTSLFAGKLVFHASSSIYSVKDFVSLLKNTKLESPVSPIDDPADFSISPDGTEVAFVSKDPDQNPATTTATYIYIVSHSGDAPPRPINAPSPSHSAEGASSNPTYSPDGKWLAFFQMHENGYEADKNNIFIANADRTVFQIAVDWDRSPSSISWSSNSKHIYFTAAEVGRTGVWKTPMLTQRPGPRNFAGSELEKLKTLGDVSSVRVVRATSTDAETDRLVITSSTLTSPAFYSILEGSGDAKIINSPNYLNKPANAHENVEEFWFRGAVDDIHGFLLKPSTFREGIKYPLAFFIHGGPQGAWSDAWNTRWNPLVYAEQGFIVATINPTGSIGYGQALTDAIKGDWGGKPYVDLEKALDYLVGNYSFIDAERAVALGASYGGYMVNWIQGNPLGRRFKALVCHDGIFSTLNQISTEELYFIHHDFNGYLWDEGSTYAKWNPAQPHLIKNWSTPQLIIHSNKDYRIPISEGLAAFNALQLQNVPSKFVTFEGEGHWVLNPENSLVWHREVISWICRWANTDFDARPYDDVGPISFEEAARISVQDPNDRLKETV